MLLRTLVALMFVTLSVAHAQTLSLTGGKTSVQLGGSTAEDANLAAAGITVVGIGNGTLTTGDLPGGVAFAVDTNSTFLFSESSVLPVAGSIEHFGTVTINQTGLQNLGDVTLGDFSISFDATRENMTTGASGFFVADTFSSLGPVFDLGNLTGIVATTTNFSVAADLLVSPELSTALAGDASLAGADVGNALVAASVPEPASVVGLSVACLALVAAHRGRK